MATTSAVYMGGVAQFGLNVFKWGQTHFCQLHLSLDPDKLEICHFVCRSITAVWGFSKVTYMDCDHCKCPKIHLKHLCKLYEDFTFLRIICLSMFEVYFGTLTAPMFNRFILLES